MRDLLYKLPSLPRLTALAGSGYRFPFCLKDLFDIPYQYRRLVKWPWQRVRRGYSDRDLWNFGDHVADVLAKGLREFLKGPIHGVPADLVEYEEDGWTMKEGAVDLGAERWRKILEEMAEGFEAVEHLGGCTKCDPHDVLAHQREYEAKWDRAMDLAKKHLLSVWD